MSVSKTAMSPRQAKSLLLPLAMSLKYGGLGQKAAESCFSAAYKEAPIRRGPELQRIGHHMPYSNLLGLWSRDKRFVAASGVPRLLALHGKNSFTTLVREVSPKSNPAEMMAVLQRYGNVRKTSREKYKLVNHYFMTTTPDDAAFEPIAFLLSDMSTMTRHLLRQKKDPRRDPRHFWQKAESTELSEAAAKKFFWYARKRGMIFLEELDDWLEAHKGSGMRKRQKRRRVGMTLFSVYSDSEVIDTAA
jgi:hypothetical protein